MILAIICEWLNHGFSSWLICVPAFRTGDIVSFIILDVFRFVPFASWDIDILPTKIIAFYEKKQLQSCVFLRKCVVLNPSNIDL